MECFILRSILHSIPISFDNIAKMPT
jgi:hypothetical protein